MDDFPGNSHRRVPPKQEMPEKDDIPEKKIEKVVSGEVVRRKPPMSRRLRGVFLGGDSTSVKEYLLVEVFIPNMKDLIVDMFQTGVERMVYGDSARPGRRGSRGGGAPGRFDYSGVSRGPIQQPRGRDDRPVPGHRARTFHEFDTIELPTRADAEAVLTQMFDILDNYEAVKVSDFYELVGYTGNFMDHKFGWDDLRGTEPRRVRGGGYILDLPQTKQLG